MANHRKDKKLVRVTVNLEPDDYKCFDKEAKKQGLSAAYLIRRAMREYLERNDSRTHRVEPVGQG